MSKYHVHQAARDRRLSALDEAEAAITPIALVDADAPAVDFGNADSQRALSVAARAVARELGREAAREYFAALIGKPKAP